MTDIRLVPLDQDDREQFILDNQEAFNYGALEEFGRRQKNPATVFQERWLRLVGTKFIPSIPHTSSLLLGNGQGHNSSSRGYYKLGCGLDQGYCLRDNISQSFSR